MTDPLQKLFGSAARVKLLRLFLFNPRQVFTISDAAARARVSEKLARAEIQLFCAAGVIKRTSPRKRAKGRFGLNENFAYLSALQALLLNTPAQAETLYPHVRNTGTIKLIIIAGVLVGDWDGRLDILIVGDRINDKKLRNRIRVLEAEVGKELRYTPLSTEDFLYRANMSDKLVRDILDYPHKVVFDRLNIGLK